MGLRLLYIFISFLFLCIFIPNSGFSDSPKVGPMHPYIPFTASRHIVRCGEVFDAVQALEDALACAENVLPNVKAEEFKEAMGSILDSCYVIKAKSPDVYSTDFFNYIREFHFFGGSVLGFYDPGLKITYLVENVDVVEIGRHEFQHHMLRVLGIPEGDHNHSIWYTCEPPRYTPSARAKRGNPHKKLRGQKVESAEVAGIPRL